MATRYNDHSYPLFLYQVNSHLTHLLLKYYISNHTQIVLVLPPFVEDAFPKIQIVKMAQTKERQSEVYLYVDTVSDTQRNFMSYW